MSEISKEERIKTELDRLSKLFEKADGNQKASVTPLLQNAAFMKVTLEDLQEIINKEGVTEIYQNGANQHGVKQSATLQSYNALIKNYASVIKTLSAILPRETKSDIKPFEWQPKIETPEEKAEREKEAAYWAEEAGRVRKMFEKNDPSI